jgi:hypothetical protein
VYHLGLSLRLINSVSKGICFSSKANQTLSQKGHQELLSLYNNTGGFLSGGSLYKLLEIGAVEGACPGLLTRRAGVFCRALSNN